MESTQGLIRIPDPIPIPAPRPLPGPVPIPGPMPIEQPSVLPPFMGVPEVTPIISQASVPALIAGRPVAGQVLPPAALIAGRPAASRVTQIPLPAPAGGPTTGPLPSPEDFWKGTVGVSVSLPSPEDFWRGVPTTSQIPLPAPEVFWKR
jgi:hypothetical protein